MHWLEGYSEAELDRIQNELGLVFPPDFAAHLRERRLAQGVDWLRDLSLVRLAIERVLDGILFDVEHDQWWPHWGEMPAGLEDRKALVTELVNAAPKLIPILGHRFLPETPHESGNPVFSIVQTDIILYGNDLEDYFFNESHGRLGRRSAAEPKWIPFWSDFVFSDPV